MTRTTLHLAALVLIAACGDKGDDTGTTGDWDPSSFESGSFQFTSNEVDDQCLDGTFRTLFMPDLEPTDWQYAVELPAWDSLPSTYSVRLQDPFSEMQVTVSEGASVGLLSIDGAAQTGVEFDETNSPGCLVEMDMQVEIVIDDADTVHGTATMLTGSFDEEYCPVVDADPCTVELDFTGTRN
jgi:hypothetical protein